MSPITTMSTMKVPTRTRDRLRDQARHERLTQVALIEAMLDDREEAEFWAALAASPAPTQEDLDEVDAFFVATADDGILP